QIVSFQTVFPPVLTGKILGNTFRLDFFGVDGATFKIFGSTNLVDWTYLGDASRISANTFRYIDTAFTNNQTRYYRAGNF
ncbi:MAG: hypothetical protein ABI042_05470, partial [Verrucomicrobiota bacterium]